MWHEATKGVPNSAHGKDREQADAPSHLELAAALGLESHVEGLDSVCEFC